MRIRSVRQADAEAVHRICVATGDAGEHSRNILREPRLMAYVFADPYLLLQPELCFVAESAGQVLGYVVTALRSDEFYARWMLEWAPRFAASHPARDVRAAHDADAWLCALLHHPRRMLADDLDHYPSHLHINVLSGARGQGIGKRLLWTAFTELRRAGSPGVQLGVRPTNAAAHAFYRAMGMTRLPLDDSPGIRFGRPLNG